MIDFAEDLEPEAVALVRVVSVRGHPVLDAVIALALQGHRAIPLDGTGHAWFSIEHATTDVETIRELDGDAPDGWGIVMGFRRAVQPQRDGLTKARFRMPQRISESRRNVTFASFVGWVLAYDFTDEETLAIALLMNSTRGDPPLPEKEVRAVVRSIARRHARQASRCESWELHLRRAVEQ